MFWSTQIHVINQLVSSVTAFLAIFMSGMWLSWISPVLPKFKSGEIPIPMTINELTWLVALMDLGNVLSAIPSGYLMDRYGRLPPLRLASILFALTSILSLTATKPYHLLTARLLAGIAKGLAFTVASIYVAEIAEPKIRGALGGLLIVMLGTGGSLSMTFGPYISFDTLNWLTFAFPILQLFLSLFIVESPYYLLMRRREDEAVKALSHVRDQMAGNSNKAELDVIRNKIEEDMRQPKDFKSLVATKGNRKALLIVLVTCLFQRAGGLSSALVFASTHLPPSSFWDSRISVMIFGWSYVTVAVLSLTLIDWFGRKPLLFVSSFGAFLIMTSSAVFYYYHQMADMDVSRFIYVPHVGIMVLGPVYALGLGQIPHVFQSELFPTNVKGQASAASVIVLAITSFTINKIYLTVDRNIGRYFMYLIFAFSDFLCMIFTLFCVVETKGKSLAEIQDLLNKT